LEESAITTKRRDEAATIFSRRWAPTTTLDQPTIGSDLVGPVDRQVECIELVESVDNDSRDRAEVSVRRDVAT